LNSISAIDFPSRRDLIFDNSTSQSQGSPVPRDSPTDAVAFHSEIASEFHASYETDPNRQERIIVWRRLIARHAPHGNLAYDVGCGSGMLTCEIAPHMRRVVAIDGSAPMIEIARKTVAERGLQNVEFEQLSLPPKGSHNFEAGEVVISSSVIEYLASVEDALAFIYTLLRPGGTLMFSISNRNSFKRAAVKLFHRLTGRPRYFGLLRHFLSVDDIRNVLEGTGFELLESEYFDSKDAVNSALSRLFPKKFSANMIVAVARRSDGVPYRPGAPVI
jgi:SAM-dependent methyltransferase